MATTNKTLDLLTGESALNLFIAMGGGNYTQGVINAYQYGKKFFPATNLWRHNFTITTTGGGATNTEVIKMYETVLFNKFDFETTDLDTVSIQFKINDRLIQISGSSDNETAPWSSKLWDAIVDVPVILGAGKHDDVSMIFTDSGGGQAIQVACVGTLVVPKTTD